MDSELRRLQRKALKTQNPMDTYRFRAACLKIGQPELAGYEIGDIVNITHSVIPQISGAPYTYTAKNRQIQAIFSRKSIYGGLSPNFICIDTRLPDDPENAAPPRAAYSGRLGDITVDNGPDGISKYIVELVKIAHPEDPTVHKVYEIFETLHVKAVPAPGFQYMTAITYSEWIGRGLTA